MDYVESFERLHYFEHRVGGIHGSNLFYHLPSSSSISVMELDTRFISADTNV